MAKVTGTKVITNEVRMAYLYWAEPKAFEDKDEPKYRATLLIPKSDKETIKAIKTAIEQVKVEGLQKWGGKLPTKDFFIPLRDGDDDAPENSGDEFEGHYFVNAKTSYKPAVVDRQKAEITDADVFQSGDYARASVTFYAFATGKNKGIGVILNALQFTTKGERLGGGNSANDFDELEADDDDL
jgi:hypothetical protein